MIWVVASLIVPVLLGLAIATLLRGIRFEETFKNLIFLPRIEGIDTPVDLLERVRLPDGHDVGFR